MTLPIYIVNAFTNGPFTGNPAAVVPLKEWLSDEQLQQIAAQNNLSETAFFVKNENGFHIRWMTPRLEVDLCGHATLATAWVIFNQLGYSEKEIVFDSRSGDLRVENHDGKMRMNFPTDKTLISELPQEYIDALSSNKPLEIYKGATDYMLVYDNERIICDMRPDFSIIKKEPVRGFLVTAAGENENDFVSRGFFPYAGIDEDPATGSAHTTLTPYWSQRLQKKHLKAQQISERGGFFECEDHGDRTILLGSGELYSKGEIYF